MDLREAVLSLAVAVAAGLLVGAEREQAAAARQRTEFGGIRTFPLVAMLGALGAIARPVAGLWLLGGSLLGLVAVLTVSHARTSSRDEIGISSEVAALLTYALGALAALPELLPGRQRFLLVGTCAAAILALLALRAPLRGFASKLSSDDVYATTKFVLLALVILPALPRATVDPLGVLSPFKVGKMIVLIAAISFAGYVAARVVGAAKGLLVAGLLGGLVSSTAVTMTYAGRSRSDPALAPLCGVAVVAACSTMFARLVVVIALLDPPLLRALGPSLGTMALVGFGVAAWRYRRLTLPAEGAGEAVQLKNPFALTQAVSFGLVYGTVLLVAKAAQLWLGRGGIYASATLAGLTDVDAITLSMTELHRGGMDGGVAATAIVLAAITNTAVKSGIARSTGGAALGRSVGGALGAALLAGGAVQAAVTLAR